MSGTAAVRWYSPGAWLAITGERCVLMVETSPDTPLYEAWAKTVTAGGSADDLLRTAVEHGIGGVPSFALVESSGQGIRAVLRGSARVWCADGRELTSDNAPTWRDGMLESSVLPMRVGDPAAGATPFRLPLTGGVAFASTIDLYADEPLVSVDPTRDAPTSATMPMATAAPPASSTSVPPSDEQRPAPVPASEATAETGGVAADFAHLFEPTITPPPVPTAAPEDIPPPVPTAAPEDTLLTRPEPVGAEGEDAPSSGVGATVPPLPEPATPTGTGSHATGVIDAVPWAAPSSGPATASEAASDARTPAAPTPAGPAASPPPPPPPSVATLPSPEAIEDHTVARSSLTDAVVGPTVFAAYCPAGHLSPVHAQYCRVCDRPIAPNQAPLTIPRPTLGMLRLPHGDTIALDRGVLLGRAPMAQDAPAGEPQHVVSLASPEKDISRNHLEIRLDGWHVLAVDLDSVNGTVVVLPGRQPQRLRPNEPVILERGATVTLADEVSLVFEVPA